MKKNKLMKKMVLILLSIILTLTFDTVTSYAGVQKPQKITASNQTVTLGTKPQSLKAKSRTARTYKSSNPKIVSVSKKGYITARRIGTVKITIQAKATKTYQAEKKVIRVSVIPAGSTIRSITAVSSSQLKVKYTNRSKVTGYQLRYAVSRKLSNAKYKTFLGTSAVISGLKPNKKYNIQVRTYKSVNGKKYYSRWSKVKYGRTKKASANVHQHNWKKVTDITTYKVKKTTVIGACNTCGYVVQDPRTGEDHTKDHVMETWEASNGKSFHGAWHTDFYDYGNYCYFCGDTFSYRTCAYGKECRRQCQKSEHFLYVEDDENDSETYMYYKSCKCGKNSVIVNEAGKGMMKGKTYYKCTVCNAVKK